MKRSIRLATLYGAAMFAWLFSPFTVAAQNSPQAPQIRVSTHLVQIGVIVRDNIGPVDKLTKDDFVVLDRGRPQSVSIFSAESSEPSPEPAQPLPPNTFSDQPQYGAQKPRSVTIVLLDNLNTLSGTAPQNYETTPFWLEDHALANAKQHLIEFLKQADARDRIAIYGLTQTLHVLCDFTCDRDQLLAVVSKYDATSHTQRDMAESGNFHFPQQPTGSGLDNAATEGAAEFTGVTNEARARTTMAALTAIASHLADIPGRKNLLWLTANLPFSGEGVARILSRANIAAYPLDARGLLPRTPGTDPAEIMDADAYALGQLGGPATMSSQPIGIDTMVKMADDTGGHAFVNSNDLTTAIRKVVEDSAVTYTLGFYVDAGSLDGKFHELKVQVKRPGLTVRYPKGYFAFKDAPANQDESHNAFLAAIRSPLVSAVIPLEVKLDRVASDPPSLQVSGLFGIKNVRLPEDGGVRKGSVDVYIIEQDAAGNVLHQANNRLALKLTETQYQAYLKSGVVFRQNVQPKPQDAVLRILVQDPGTLELGSVIIPLSRVN